MRPTVICASSELFAPVRKGGRVEMGMSRRRDKPVGPIFLLIRMYRDDPAVFYLFVSGLVLIALASAIAVLMHAP